MEDHPSEKFEMGPKNKKIEDHLPQADSRKQFLNIEYAIVNPFGDYMMIINSWISNIVYVYVCIVYSIEPCLSTIREQKYVYFNDNLDNKLNIIRQYQASWHKVYHRFFSKIFFTDWSTFQVILYFIPGFYITLSVKNFYSDVSLSGMRLLLVCEPSFLTFWNHVNVSTLSLPLTILKVSIMSAIFLNFSQWCSAFQYSYLCIKAWQRTANSIFKIWT